MSIAEASPPEAPPTGGRWLEDAWYGVAPSESVSRTPVQRWLFERPIVLYRDLNGEVVALDDTCPHRKAPLSRGVVTGDEIRCPYHGLQFGPSGHCTKVPGESVIPSVLTLKRFAAFERYGIVWLWGGAPDEADLGRLIDWPWFDEPGYLSIRQELVVEAPVEMVIDNLMDLSHVHFVHKFGVELMVHEGRSMQVERTAEGLTYTRAVGGGRYLSDIAAEVARGDETMMDIGGEYHPPTTVVTFGLTRQAETGVLAQGPHRRFIHALTPETPTRTRYVALRSWNTNHRPDEVAAAKEEDRAALQEDKEIIEMTFRQMSQLREPGPLRLLPMDQAAVLANRIFKTFGRRATTKVNS